MFTEHSGLAASHLTSAYTLGHDSVRRAVLHQRNADSIMVCSSLPILCSQTSLTDQAPPRLHRPLTPIGGVSRHHVRRLIHRVLQNQPRDSETAHLVISILLTYLRLRADHALPLHIRQRSGDSMQLKRP